MISNFGFMTFILQFFLLVSSSTHHVFVYFHSSSQKINSSRNLIFCNFTAIPLKTLRLIYVLRTKVNAANEQ